jgi:predicted Zn-dependent peptidase
MASASVASERLRSPRFRVSVLVLALAVDGCAGARPPLPPAPARELPAAALGEGDAPNVAPDVPFEAPALTSWRTRSGVVVTRIHRPAQRVPTLAVLFGSSSRSDPVDVILVEALRRKVDRNTGVHVRVDRFGGPAGLGILVDAPPDAVADSVEALREAMTGLPTGNGVEEARLRVMRELADASRGGGQMVQTILRRQRYGDGHPWARDAISTVQGLGELDEDDLVEKVEDRIQPRRTHLVLSGSDASWADVDFGWLDDWRRSPGSEATPVRVPPLEADRKLMFHMLGAPPESGSLFALHTGPGLSSPDQPAFAALCHLLGGMLSEAGREFRHEGGGTYGVHTDLHERLEVSECLWFGNFEAGLLPRAADQHLRQLQRLQAGEIDRRSLVAAKGRVRSEHERRFSNPRALTRWVARQRGLGHDVAEIRSAWDREPDLSDARLRRVARAAFRPKGLDFVALVGSTQDYIGLSARGGILSYKVERADED